MGAVKHVKNLWRINKWNSLIKRGNARLSI